MSSQKRQASVGVISRGFALGAVAVASCVGVTRGQVLHQADMVIRWSVDGAIETGLPSGDSSVVWGERVVAGRFDTGQFANLADDPGFDSFSGSFPVGTGIGLDILGSLRVWENDSFETIDPEYALSITKGNDIVTSSPDDSRVAGFQFGAADTAGRFHHHVRFFLDPFDPFSDVPGLWMIPLELWSTSPVVLPSEPVYVVFSSGGEALAQRDLAIEWIENNLIGGPCGPADLAEPFGTLDLADITTFAAAFSSGDPAADLAAPEGLLDLQDINAFVTSFVAGCP